MAPGNGMRANCGAWMRAAARCWKRSRCPKALVSQGWNPTVPTGSSAAVAAAARSARCAALVSELTTDQTVGPSLLPQFDLRWTIEVIPHSPSDKHHREGEIPKAFLKWRVI